MGIDLSNPYIHSTTVLCDYRSESVLEVTASFSLPLLFHETTLDLVKSATG